MYSAVVVAGGSGLRSGLPYNKVLHEIHQKPVLMYSVECFLRDQDCGEVIVVASSEDKEKILEIVPSSVKVVEGGETRGDSVYQGLLAATKTYVMIHDAARPNINVTMLRAIKEAWKTEDAVTLGVTVADTIKTVKVGYVHRGVDRDEIIAVQTPQGFLRALIIDAYDKKYPQAKYTCDASIVQEVLNKPIKVVQGSRLNVKFTTEEDLKLLEMIL